MVSPRERPAASRSGSDADPPMATPLGRIVKHLIHKRPRYFQKSAELMMMLKSNSTLRDNSFIDSSFIRLNGRDYSMRISAASGTDHLRGVFPRSGTGEIEKALRSRQSNSTKRDSLTLILRRGKMLDQPGAGGVGNLSPARACTAAR